MSPRPAKPDAGDPVLASLGGELVAYAKEQMEFIRTPRGAYTYEIVNVTGNGAWQQLELPLLPANDPLVKYAVVIVVLRCGTTGDNASLSLAGQSSGAPAAAVTYNGPTAGRGGAGGPFLVPVGGTNGRSIWWLATATVSRVWIASLGYWRRVG